MHLRARRRRALLAVVACLFLVLPPTIASGQAAAVSGQVTLGQESRTRQRASRGATYRARGRSTRATSRSAPATATTNPFADVIISAHPLGASPPLPAASEAVMYQRDANFSPRVLPVVSGTEVQFINDDDFFHNVFSLTPNAQFNIGRRQPGVVVPQVLTAPQEVKVFCDIHSQMRGSVLVLNTPYFARAAEDGSYALRGLPAGRYELRAFHPDFGERSVQVTLTGRQTASQDISFMS